MNKAFSLANTMTAQPSANTPLYIRSDGSDSRTITIAGSDSGPTPRTQTLTLLSQREIVPVNSYLLINSLVLSGIDLARTVKVFDGSDGTAGIGYIIFTTQPANNDTVRIGLTGLTQTYTFKTTLTGAANEIKIGAAASDTADNLKRAINDTGVEGTNYGVGTAANAYVSATVSGTIVTITDKIKADRLLAWVVDQTVGTTLSIEAPLCGVDGTLLATLAPSVIQRTAAMNFSTEALDTVTLPAYVAGIKSDPVRVGGVRCTIRLGAGNMDDALTGLTYETSTDAINWQEAHTIGDLTGTTIFVSPDENMEYVRLGIPDGDANNVYLDARVTFG